MGFPRLISAGFSYLVIALAQELESLGTLVHEDPVQMARLHGTNLNGLLAPSHDLVGANICYAGRVGRISAHITIIGLLTS